MFLTSLMEINAESVSVTKPLFRRILAEIPFGNRWVMQYVKDAGSAAREEKVSSCIANVLCIHIFFRYTVFQRQRNADNLCGGKKNTDIRASLNFVEFLYCRGK